MASTQPPNDSATYPLSTRMRNASASMSKRAPSSETVPVRRATQPSTASSASAMAASGTSTATGSGRSTDSTTNAVTPPTSVARASVTRSAGPSRDRRSNISTTSPYPTPVNQPAQPSPTVVVRIARTTSWPTNPTTASVRTVGTPPPSRWVSAPLTTGPATVRFGEGRGPMAGEAGAFWLREPGTGEIRTVPLPAPGPGEVRVKTRFSGVSRGTETLVFRGEVPPDQYATMRAPFQEGEFPAPVKYGYLSVGEVTAGPAELLGRTVFCLYPHQTGYVVPAEAVVPVPAGVPAERAVLAGTVETAINALWDARPRIGDRVAVVGAGMVGCCVAALLARFPGVDLQLVDADPGKQAVATALGVPFAAPADAAGGRDLVVHASATGSGLQRSLDLLAPEGTVLELSWYGDHRIELALGGAFHSDRLTIRSSQVGTVARPDRTYRERLGLALDLLRDPRFDALITGRSAFAELPSVLAGLASGDIPALCHLVTYGE
jgi:threonine dehydrogenase-like Zn-dependent dehydrogenase